MHQITQIDDDEFEDVTIKLQVLTSSDDPSIEDAELILEFFEEAQREIIEVYFDS